MNFYRWFVVMIMAAGMMIFAGCEDDEGDSDGAHPKSTFQNNSSYTVTIAYGWFVDQNGYILNPSSFALAPMQSKTITHAEDFPIYSAYEPRNRVTGYQSGSLYYFLNRSSGGSGSGDDDSGSGGATIPATPAVF